MADSSEFQFAKITRSWILSGLHPDLEFDTVVREVHRSELAITDSPLETGVVASDHAYLLPKVLEIEACVGDVWLHGVDEQGRPVDDVFASDVSRAVKAYAVLEELQATAEPFSVQTGLKLYANMLLVALDAEQDKDTAAMLSFRATLREVKIVSTQTVSYPPRKDGKPTHQAAKPTTAGEKKTDPVTEPAKAQSILHSMVTKDGQFDFGGAVSFFTGGAPAPTTP